MKQNEMRERKLIMHDQFQFQIFSNSHILIHKSCKDYCFEGKKKRIFSFMFFFKKKKKKKILFFFFFLKKKKKKKRKKEKKKNYDVGP